MIEYYKQNVMENDIVDCKKMLKWISLNVDISFDNIDFELMMMEDYMHGEDGNEITKMRGLITELKNETRIKN